MPLPLETPELLSGAGTRDHAEGTGTDRSGRRHLDGGGRTRKPPELETNMTDLLNLGTGTVVTFTRDGRDRTGLIIEVYKAAVNPSDPRDVVYVVRAASFAAKFYVGPDDVTVIDRTVPEPGQWWRIDIAGREPRTVRVIAVDGLHAVVTGMTGMYDLTYSCWTHVGDACPDEPEGR